MSEELTAERLRQLLSYEAESGLFRWLVGGQNYPVNIGDVAGYDNGRGYIVIGLLYRTYRAHRLAWLYSYGEWPSKDIDHVNRNRHDNRLSNLRQATRSENMANTGISRRNTSGLKGVSYNPKRKLWRACITVNWKNNVLGYFETKELAAAAYASAALEFRGEFANVENSLS